MNHDDHRPPESPLLTRHTCAQLYQNVTRGDALSREVAAGEEADETVVFKKLRHRINLETPPACVEGKPHNGIAIFNQQGADPMNDRQVAMPHTRTSRAISLISEYL